MRYVLWLMVIIGDIITLGICYFAVTELGPLGIILGAIVLMRWNSLGGFEAWQPSKVKKWFADAKARGL